MDIVLICVGVLVAVLGIFMLVTPYEKIASKMEGNPTRRNIRIRGAVILVCGILLVVLQVLSILIENGVI